MNKTAGDEGEAFVAQLLRARGYTVRHIGGNYPVIDLEVDASRPFRVSVKNSLSRRHVRMGREASILQLRDDDYMFALMPMADSAMIVLQPSGGYDLLIIPGHVAREDALYVHRSYLAGPSRSGQPRTGSAGVMIKEYSSRSQQRQVWERWLHYREAWDQLPPPS